MEDQCLGEEAIFKVACQIKSPQARTAYLAQVCGDDRALLERVALLLRVHEEEPGFLESPAAGLPATVETPQIAERPGSVIGPYRLLQQIGEGGFGIVFMADQQDPVRRCVALKVVKPGMDTRQVLARFKAELQALSLMDHPNIARVLDAGATESGRPYFVMELVRGIPITDYCDQNKLPVHERLDLFVQVCHAVQHAHQKGIIHRDIKPSNVLVTVNDGRPVPKVIDFGVAKAIGRQLTQETVFTHFAEMIGTPLYMSPEQAEMSGLDIDTRSDIYSLGVLLYELLTGSTPFEKDRLRQAAYDEVRRIIREEEPPKPSQRISSMADTRTLVAAYRNADPQRLSQIVRGDLDWIVMKALEKDRAHRYDTAGNFAADVLRYLSDQPIEAHPPSAVYRFKKFARRNRVALTTAVLVGLTLLAGIGVSTWQAIRATRAEKAALAREAETKAVLEFVEDRIFAAARPEGESGGLGRAVTLRKAIDSALSYVDQGFPNQPLIEARLRLTLGRSFYFLGDAPTAAKLEEAARALYTRHLGPDHPDTLQSMHNLANSYGALGRHTDALKLREETLALRKAKLGPDHPDTLSSMNTLANSYQALGRLGDALKLREETLALRKVTLGPDHPDTLKSMNNLALSYAALGRYPDGLKLRQETLALETAKLGPNHPDTLASMTNLAESYCAVGRYADALKLHEETLALQKAKLGPDHPDTLVSRMNLATTYTALGRYADALKLNEETLALQKTKLGADHAHTLLTMNNLAGNYYVLGRHADAMKLVQETLALQKAKLGPDHPDTLQSMHGLAAIYFSLARHAEARKLFEETVVLRRAKLGPDHPDTLSSMIGVAASCDELGRHVDALKFYEEALALQKAKLGPNHAHTLVTMNNVANSYYSLGRYADACNLFEETLALRKARLGPDHPDTLTTMNDLAESYEALGRDADALKLRETTLALRKTKLGPDHPDTLKSMLGVAKSLMTVRRAADALSVIDDCLKRAAGKDADPRLLPELIDLRLRHFEKTKDAAGCRQTTAMWEKLNRIDADSLYKTACLRAVTGALLRAADASASAAIQANAEADHAMASLKQAVTAGYKDAAHMKKDKDLDSLRAREDFKKLVADLDRLNEKEKSTP